MLKILSEFYQIYESQTIFYLNPFKKFSINFKFSNVLSSALIIFLFKKHLQNTRTIPKYLTYWMYVGLYIKTAT